MRLRIWGVNVGVLQMQIRMLSDCLNKRIEENNYIIDDDIVRLSQVVDNYIVMHERLQQDMKSKN
jgi:hypothetical protein